MLIFDLESDGLLDELTEIHTLHMFDTATGEYMRFNEGFFADGTRAERDGDIGDAIGLLERADEICGHNIIGFDIPAIKKIFPDFEPVGVVHDTLIYSRYIFPHMAEIDSNAIRKNRRPEGFGRLTGSHNLKSWGIRLGEHKGDYTGGWSDFTQDMEEYAFQDVVVTRALWNFLSDRDYCEEAVRLEHDTARIIHMQERFGFKFNTAKAEELEFILRGRKAELEDHLRSIFPAWEEPVRKGGVPYVFVPKRDNAKLGYKAGVGVPKFKTVSFNPASRDHIANRLIAIYGWQPVEKTENGKPKVDETTLGGLDFPEAKMLVEYLTVDKRLGAVAEGNQAWLKRVGPDGRIHGRVNTLGAVTRRMTHSYPNMAQVPAVRAPYGKDCRGLFMVGEGNKLVGCDAEGLELRMLAHYMARFDGGAYVNTVVNGNKDDGTDVHTVNQKFIGLNSRDAAKTWIYAYLYGAGNLKLGSVMYDDFTDEKRTKFHAKYPAGDLRDRALARLGTRARRSVEEGLPALGKLQEKVKELAKRGYLKTVDGGRLRVRSAHAALNTLLQGGGAVVMKKALVILFDKLIAEGFVPNDLTGELVRYHETIGFVANIHDEFQLEVPEHIAEWLGQLSSDAIREAGEQFTLRCPLAGAYQVGNTWADSH
jgi:hypothetical protein